MDVGLMLEPVHRKPGDTRPLVELYDEAMAFCEWADRLGADNIWIGEHHFMDKQWNTSPLLLLAALARRTERVRLGCNVLLTPLYEPVRLIEDIATLDLLTNGRVDIAFGTGSVTFEFETFRIPEEERHGRTFEIMQLLRRGFSEEGAFDHDGKYYQIPHLKLTTQPVQKPFPIWFGGFGPKNLARAGRLGFHVAAPFEGPYEEGFRENGGDPDLIHSMARPSVVVAPREADIPAMQEELARIAQETIKEYTATRNLAFQNMKPDNMGARRPATFVGTPDQVLAHLEPQLKHSRATHIITGMASNHAMDWGMRHKDSVELFLKEVAPVIRTWGGQPIHKRAAARKPVPAE